MPRPPDIAPTSEATDRGTTKTHPAYGMLSFSRVSGNPGKLFGSEINHGHFIRMTLLEGEEHWHHSQVWHHGRISRTLVEVDLSVAQWAELISSMNVGSGVPATIRYVDDPMGTRPGIEDTDTLHEQIKGDIKAKTAKVTSVAKSLDKEMAAMLADSKVPKAKQAALLALTRHIVMELESNMPFVVDQYQEAAEKVGAKAKAELDAYATSVIHRLGEQALAQLNETPPKPELNV